MSKGIRKNRFKPKFCSRSVCKKIWINKHGSLYPPLDPIRDMEIALYRQYPDAWQDLN